MFGGSLPRALSLVALLAASTATSLSAQSLFANRGLGLTVEPQDARSDALGGVSLGLPGGEIAWANPAGAVGLPAAGLTLAFRYDDFAARFGGRTADGSTARFPMILGAFPFGEKLAFTAGFGGYLDQNWAVQQGDTLLLGEDSVAVLDRFTSEGGVSQFRLGAGYRVVPGLSVGVGLDMFTGGVARVSGRLFPGQSEPQCCRAEWRYSGVGYLASLDWNPSEALSVSVGASTGGTLDAEERRVEEDSVEENGAERTGEARSYDLPTQFHAGASGRVAPNLLIAAKVGWAGWSSLEQSFAAQGGARDTWSLHGGAEWDALTLFGRTLPLRLGVLSRDLPFRWDDAGSEWASERALTGGTGLVLGGGAARLDVSAQRGWRGSDAVGLEESFWRVGLSVTVLGR